jgi:hypothetical protein
MHRPASARSAWSQRRQSAACLRIRPELTELRRP